MGSLDIPIYELLYSFGNFIFHFSMRKKNKGFFFPHSPIYYLRSRTLTLKYCLSFNSKSLKMKIRFSIIILKVDFLELICFLIRCQVKLKIGAKVNFQSKNAIEN